MPKCHVEMTIPLSILARHTSMPAHNIVLRAPLCTAFPSAPPPYTRGRHSRPRSDLRQNLRLKSTARTTRRRRQCRQSWCGQPQTRCRGEPSHVSAPAMQTRLRALAWPAMHSVARTRSTHQRALPVGIHMRSCSWHTRVSQKPQVKTGMQQTSVPFHPAPASAYPGLLSSFLRGID